MRHMVAWRSALDWPGGAAGLRRCLTVTAVSPRKARRLPADLPRRPRGGVRPGPAARRGEDDGPATRLGPERTETWPDGDWGVRSVPGPAAAQTSRWPGGGQGIRPGVAPARAWGA